MNDLVSIVIPTCGKHDYLAACLGSIQQQTHRSIEVIVIDNSFDPAVAVKARSIYPAVQIYPAEHNLFYCDSMNKGIELSHGEFVLCLNDDVTLEARFIEVALSGFSKQNDIGMVSGKILRQDGRTIDSTGLFLSVWRTARERGYGQPDVGQLDEEGRIFGVSGAAAFYRRKMLDVIKLNNDWFDPAFRIFYEDLDVAWRANRCGWTAYYMPRALAYHVRGGSVRENTGVGRSFARQYLSDELNVDLIKNRYLAMMRNETLASFVLCLIPILLHDLCAWGYVLLFKPQIAGRIVAGLAKARRSRQRSTLFREERT
ncbi:MAG: glycosyltransferase [Candidatus Omnitrophica bacterium]|nr:glycosyltransferase [Candidatus Omnitrophota bacterium]